MQTSIQHDNFVANRSCPRTTRQRKSTVDGDVLVDDSGRGEGKTTYKQPQSMDCAIINEPDEIYSQTS